MSIYCARKHIILQSKTDKGNTYKSIPLFCKSWDCPECAKSKWEGIKKRISTTFSGDVYLLTLTYAQNGKSLDDVWSNIGSSWNRLLSYIRTAVGKKVKYIRIVEPHKSGYPHLHVILDKPLDFITDLKNLEFQGFGSIAHQKVIPLQAGIAYLSKYLTKGHWDSKASFYRKKHRVRIFSSSRLKKLPGLEGVKWELASSSKKITGNAIDFANIFSDELKQGNYLSSLGLNFGILTAVFSKHEVNTDIDYSVLSDIHIEMLAISIFHFFNESRDNEKNISLFTDFMEKTGLIRAFNLRLNAEYYNYVRNND